MSTKSRMESVFKKRPVNRKHDELLLAQDIIKLLNLEVQRNRRNKTYSISVTTSDERSAGTDANVKITFYGEYGDSGKRPLEQRFLFCYTLVIFLINNTFYYIRWRDLFERGQTDNFEVNCLDLGELDRIKLEHDNKMLKPDWKPLKVVISSYSK